MALSIAFLDLGAKIVFIKDPFKILYGVFVF